VTHPPPADPDPEAASVNDTGAINPAVASSLTRSPPSESGDTRLSSDVEKATGAAPASLADFALRTAAAWAVDEAR
jgi:hypothetical protein